MNEEEIRETLQKMEKDPNFVTESAYRANTEAFPKNRISFTEKHLSYLKNLKSHPTLTPEHYLSNLRLRIRKR